MAYISFRLFAMEGRMKTKFLVPAVVCLLLLNAGACSKKDGSANAQGRSDRSGPKGWIEIKGADYTGHEVRTSGAGEKVDVVNSLRSTVAVPAGRYEVTFGTSVWKDVEVKAGETTRLIPGSLVVSHASLQGHDVLDEAGAVEGRVSATMDNITLIPGRYTVMFGPLGWAAEVKAGETVKLDPGIVDVVRADSAGHKIFDASGQLVGHVSNIQSSIPLPPGSYVIDLDGTKTPFTLKDGDRLKFERK